MELTPLQRLTAFIAVVGLLVGLGAYLFLPSALGSGGTGSGSPGTGASGHHASARQPSSQGPTGPGNTPTAGPAGGPPAPGGSPPDIYQWLPFSQAGLAVAAQDTVTFATDYTTYSYTQDANAYLAPMRPLITNQLAQLLGRAYAAPGVTSVRVSKRQVATGQAVIVSLRAYGPSSLIFVVELTQRITSGTSASQQVTSYAITLTGSGTSWQVSDIELASAGNS